MKDKLPIKPVEEYLINGPIPADDLIVLDFLGIYLEYDIIDTLLDIQFMLEDISIHGAPKWWKGTVSEFEWEFHEQHHSSINKLELNSDVVWHAAYAEVRQGRLSDLSEDATIEQTKEFLSHGLRRVRQTWAVETLMIMWVIAKENEVSMELAKLNAVSQKEKGESQMKEVIIINLLDPAIAQMTAKILNRKYAGFSFKVTKYYSEYHHVVTFQDVSQEQLSEMKGYAMGVSDMLGKLLEA